MCFWKSILHVSFPKAFLLWLGVVMQMRENMEPPCSITDLTVHLSYLKMLNYCCNSGDVLLGLYQVMKWILWIGNLFIVPSRAKFGVNLKFELGPLKVSSKELLRVLNVACFSSFMCFVLISWPYLYVFIAAHVPWRWTAGSFLSNWALRSSLQELYSLLRRWAAAHWKLQTP